MINPIGIWEISGALSGKSERNNLGFAEAWWRPYPGLLTYGSFVVDNTSVGDEGKGSGFTQYAGALGLHFPFITQSLSARLDFSVVSALAYRSRVAFFEYYTFDGLGLARDKTDVILLDAKAQWFALKGLFLEPGIEFQWKGEDNITDPFPDDAFTGRDKLLVGTVETTVRPVLDGRWHFPRTSSPWRGLSLELAFDAGLNVVKNKDHSNAGWKADFVGSVWFRVVQAF